MASDSLNYCFSSPRSNSPLSDGYYSASIGNSSDFDVGSICSDVKPSLNGDYLDDDDSLYDLSLRRSSNDDELSLWSNDSLSMTSNRAELSPTDTLSAWDYFEESSTDKLNTREEQSNLSLPTHQFVELLKIKLQIYF